MKRIKDTIFWVCLVLPSIVYGWLVIPYGWDKWMNSQNYAAGDFGKFLFFSPVIVLALTVAGYIYFPRKKKK